MEHARFAGHRGRLLDHLSVRLPPHLPTAADAIHRRGVPHSAVPALLRRQLHAGDSAGKEVLLTGLLISSRMTGSLVCMVYD